MLRARTLGLSTRYNTLYSFDESGLEQVQMKEQILRGLLRSRTDGDGAPEAGGAASLEVAIQRADDRSDVGDTWKRREDLVKTGAVTPLDALDDLAVGLVGRRRKTLQDYKIAEGMSVKLPRSRRAKTRPRTSCSEAGPDRVGDNQGGLGTAAGVDVEKTVECPLCAQPVKVDDPASPDVSISRHMDRCSRSSRRKSRHRPPGEDCVTRSGDIASIEEAATTRKGPCRQTFAVVYSVVFYS